MRARRSSLSVPRSSERMLGYADLAASLGSAPGPAPPERCSHAQETLLVAARAAGTQAIDGLYLEIRDDAGLRLRAEPAPVLDWSFVAVVA